MARARRRAAGVTAALGAGVGLLLVVGGAEAQSWRTVTTSRQLAGEESLDVEVSYGAGRFRVGPAEPGLLYRMQLRYDEEAFVPVNEYRGGRLRLGTEGNGEGISLGRGRSGGELDLRLTRAVPMDLRLRFGAVRADLDLGGLSLTDLELSTGASESRIDVSEPNPVPMRRAELEVGAAEFTARHLGNLNAERIEIDAGVGEVTLEFTGEWRRDAAVTVDLGLGALELRFPEGLGVKLEKDSFLTSLDAQRMVKRNDAYYSLGWDEAERKITVSVDAALGSVSVAWVR